MAYETKNQRASSGMKKAASALAYVVASRRHMWQPRHGVSKYRSVASAKRQWRNGEENVTSAKHGSISA